MRFKTDLLRILVLSAAAIPATVLHAQHARHGALAVDEAQGYHFGFAYDHSDRAAAEQAAAGFCREHGGATCRVVLSWAGEGCGAYQSIASDATGYAYGWGLAGNRAQAESIASQELSVRSGGRMAENRAWSCNSKGSGPMEVLVQREPAASEGPVVLVDKDGDKYEYMGPLAKGRPHGRGSARFIESGNRYEGEFVNGFRQGRGVYTWPSGARYEGEFANDAFNGRGVYAWRNGTRYEGGFADGKFDGQGVYVKSDGDRYEGRFAGNAFHGRGVYTFSSGARYEGEYVKGKKEGQGTFRYSDGGSYVGQFRNGVREGFGRETSADGSLKFEGQWANDDPVR